MEEAEYDELERLDVLSLEWNWEIAGRRIIYNESMIENIIAIYSKVGWIYLDWEI